MKVVKTQTDDSGKVQYVLLEARMTFDEYKSFGGHSMKDWLKAFKLGHLPEVDRAFSLSWQFGIDRTEVVFQVYSYSPIFQNDEGQ